MQKQQNLKGLKLQLNQALQELKELKFIHREGSRLYTEKLYLLRRKAKDYKNKIETLGHGTIILINNKPKNNKEVLSTFYINISIVDAIELYKYLNKDLNNEDFTVEEIKAGESLEFFKSRKEI